MACAFDSFSPKQWEQFCETMIRRHYGADNFYTVPDQDEGDLGIEFFTVNGDLFQCYRPEPGVEMKVYKQRVKNKIYEDLAKLKTYQTEISALLDDIVIKRWILLIPENKSKDFIAYCNKKGKDVKSDGLPFIHSTDFRVKVETADSYPHAKAYALSCSDSLISIPVEQVGDLEQQIWAETNSTFMSNIAKKSDAILGATNDRFNHLVVTKYIQIQRLLDQLRSDYPELYILIEDSARAQLEHVATASVIEANWDQQFLKKVVAENKEAFAKYAKQLSDSNLELISFGYLSKWLAECDLRYE